MTYVDSEYRQPISNRFGFMGAPQAGKTEAALILTEFFGFEMADSGEPMRDFCRRHLGLTYDDVYSQTGKLKTSRICAVEMEHRQILGDLGKKFEELFGEDILQWMICRKLTPDKKVAIGSVRRGQGHYLKEQGFVLVELINPLAPPVRYDFDRYDDSMVDYVINNDHLARGQDKKSARNSLWQQLFAIYHGFDDEALADLGVERRQRISAAA